MPTAKISIREISRRTGYSPATVSNALNNKRGVSEKTADEIRRVAEELGYRRPATGRLRQVQFVVARQSGKLIAEGAFRLGVINGIEYEARKRGLLASYMNLDLMNEQATRRKLDELLNDPTSGTILLGTEMIESDYGLFADAESPLVVVDGVSDDHFLECIVFSNEGSAWRAVRHLVDCGHKRIGYLAGKLRIRNFPLRERGYERALVEAGLPVCERYRVMLGTDSPEEAYRDMLAWLDEGPELPTAFFADNDTLAVGAIRALIERGYDVPGEVSVVGFDDLEYAAVMQPPLTTIHVPRFDIGRMAVRKIVEQAENPAPYTCVTHVSTALVKRDSVRVLG